MEYSEIAYHFYCDVYLGCLMAQQLPKFSKPIRSGNPRHLLKGVAVSISLAKNQRSILLNTFDKLLSWPKIPRQIVNFDANFVDESHSDCFLFCVHTTDCRACTT
jgi:hypothetical protein